MGFKQNQMKITLYNTSFIYTCITILALYKRNKQYEV
jgi:hypothetical protein